MNLARENRSAAAEDVIVGRRAIAEALHVSERTVTRYMTAGTLPAAKLGPAANNKLIARRADVEKVR